MAKARRARSELIPEDSIGLTDQQLKLVEGLAVLNMKPAHAQRYAGYPNAGSMHRDLQNPNVSAAIREQREINAERLNITREKVYAGMMEAIDMARVMADPASMIRGWREVGLVAGLYDQDPSQTKNLSDVQKRAISRIKEMSEEELLMLAAKDVTNGVTIDQETSKAH